MTIEGDRVAGFSDIHQNLCVGLALWNGRDAFGATTTRTPRFEIKVTNAGHEADMIHDLLYPGNKA